MTLLKVVCGVCLRHGRLKNWPSIKRQMKSDRSEHTIRLKFQSLAEEAMKPLEKRNRTVRLPNQEQWDKLAVAMYYIYGNGSKTIQALEDLDDALQVIIAAGKDYMNAIAQGVISFTSEEEIGSHDSSLNKSGNEESSKDIEPPGQSREATKAERAKRLMTPLGKASGAPLFQGIVIHPAPLDGRQSPLQASEEDTMSDDGVYYSRHEVSSKEDTETPIQYQERGVGCSSTLDGRELALQASAADTSSVLLASSDSEVVSWTVEELSSLINCIDICYPNWSQVKAYMSTERSPQCIKHAWKELVESEKLQNPGADWEFHGLKLGSALLNKMITAHETVTMLEAAAVRK
ncbi:unnamed protein product [Linum tenue]|uniref:Myb-like domain-containing protein n=2 Tax=Linum tenue TaxID=586396 RepID=A0AAV0I4N0_9ROSI|nr:unnamed protein product [Linum tenue]